MLVRWPPPRQLNVIPLRFLKTNLGSGLVIHLNGTSYQLRALLVWPGRRALNGIRELSARSLSTEGLRVTIWGGLTNRWTRAESAGLSSARLECLRSCSPPRQLNRYPAPLFENQLSAWPRDSHGWHVERNRALLVWPGRRRALNGIRELSARSLSTEGLRVTIWGGLTNRWTRAEPAGFVIDNRRSVS